MRAPRFYLSFLVLALVTAGPAWGLGGRADAPRDTLSVEARQSWGSLLEEGLREGLGPQQLEHTAARLAAAGLSAEEGRSALRPAFQAARMGLPPAPVLSKLEEGAGKGASAAALAEAAAARLAALRRARELLGPQSSGGGTGLLVATALALESGLSETSLQSALDRGSGTPPGRVKAVVEAGEALHLAGMDAETVAALMLDCLERDLRRPEILRLVRFAEEQSRSGRTGKEVRTALWGSDAAAGPRHGGGGGMGSAPGDSDGHRDPMGPGNRRGGMR